MYALYLVGPIVEGLYGSARFLLFYLLTAAAASTLSYVITPNDAVGASGAIFGLFGILFVAQRIHHPLMDRQARSIATQIGALIVINLVIGFGLAGGGVGIDNFAHVGGLLAGAWIGLTIATAVADPGQLLHPSGRSAAGDEPAQHPAAGRRRLRPGGGHRHRHRSAPPGDRRHRPWQRRRRRCHRQMRTRRSAPERALRRGIGARRPGSRPAGRDANRSGR